MDILLDRVPDIAALASFLHHLYPGHRCLLHSLSQPGWDSWQGEEIIIHYEDRPGIPGPFRFGLSVDRQPGEALSFIERLTAALADHFACGALCDAARFYGGRPNVPQSLLFRDGRVFLVDDFALEESGQVRLIRELDYLPPG